MSMWDIPGASGNIHIGMNQYLGLQESDDVAILVYMILDEGYDSNVDMDSIL